jgi:excisionase family DNA binding protein
MPITLTLKKAAEESGLSVRTLQYAIGNGKLQSVTVGRRRLIPARALERFLLQGSHSARRAQTQRSVSNVKEEESGEVQ